MFFRIRHYIKRAVRAEARERELQAKYDALQETMHRRDGEWADRWLQIHGQFGLSTPTIPEPPKREEQKTEPRLTAMEEATIEGYQRAAVQAGRPAQDGIKFFWAQKLGEVNEDLDDGYES